MRGWPALQPKMFSQRDVLEVVAVYCCTTLDPASPIKRVVSLALLTLRLASQPGSAREREARWVDAVGKIHLVVGVDVDSLGVPFDGFLPLPCLESLVPWKQPSVQCGKYFQRRSSRHRQCISSAKRQNKTLSTSANLFERDQHSPSFLNASACTFHSSSSFTSSAGGSATRVVSSFGATAAAAVSSAITRQRQSKRGRHCQRTRTKERRLIEQGTWLCLRSPFLLPGLIMEALALLLTEAC